VDAGNYTATGLSDEQVLSSRRKYGYNRLSYKRQYKFLDSLTSLIKEPMVILLLVASAIYLSLGKTGDAIFLTCAIIFISAISLYQESRSRNAMLKLESFTQPMAKVVRNGRVNEIKSSELAVGDHLITEEGSFIAADGVIVHSNDFSVNEAILTGESLSVYKNSEASDNKIYAGTTAVSGLAIAVVSAIGNETRLGKIGKSLENIKEEKTPLELEINHFVRVMVAIGAIIFVFIWVVNFFKTHMVMDSLLKAMTLAMSILPEEIPVAFTAFMALGARHMMQQGILVKKLKTVETLGSATVMCTDKTGTLTMNEMALANFYALETDRISGLEDKLTGPEAELITFAMWASEPIPFDPMEIALHNAYVKITAKDERKDFSMIHEYPLSGTPPMMTHVYEDHAGHRIIAAKGAPEALMHVSELTLNERETLQRIITTLASKGYRLLGVAEAKFSGDNFPDTQQQFSFAFKGIVAFYDPPKANITYVLQQFYNAGISVKIVTGDNAVTTHAIAEQIGFRGLDSAISGDDIMKVNENGLRKIVEEKNVFARMFPEAKLRVINALKANNEVVAMTGDGINDGPALKAAHIGIAMGKKGTETAKEAASLILVQDDLSKMLDAVAIGRKIYSNLKKAVQYIMSIHIAIILTVIMPLALGWVYPNIFSPIHIIFFELIMGPTCSVIYENEPAERNIMLQPPRPYTATFFNWKELATSMLQGFVIIAGVLLVYVYSVKMWKNEETTRTMVFTTIITANIFLTLVNRSFYYSFFTTLRYRNNLVLLIIALTIGVSGLIMTVRPVRIFFQFSELNLLQLSLSILSGTLSVCWYEAVKWIKRLKTH